MLPAVGLVVGPGAVLLGHRGVDQARRSVEAALRVLARDGIGPPPQLRELLALLAEASGSAVGTAAHAHVGTAEPPTGAARAAWSAQDLLEVSEVADVLGCSPGYARRLCRDGVLESAHQVAGRWLVARVEVEALREDRGRTRSTA